MRFHRLWWGLFILTALACSALAGVPNIRIEPHSIFVPNEPNPTIFVELDWMEAADHNHRPSQAVLDTIAATFAREGYNIQIDVSNAVPHEEVIALQNTGPSGAPQVQAIMATHFQHMGDPNYRYSIWAHEYSFNGERNGSSGVADLPGRVCLVTLGTFANQVGTERQQVGTFVHEFGHNLGQRHGGQNDLPNHQPNYVSIMNYSYQLTGIPLGLVLLGFHPTGQGFNEFGYSHGIFDPMDETNLSEPNGMGLASVDWNQDGDTFDTGVLRDVSIADWRTIPPQPMFSVLNDFDNWMSVQATVGIGTNAVTAIAPTERGLPEMCMTSDQYNTMMAARPDLAALAAEPLPRGESITMPPTPMGFASDQGSFTIFNDGDAPLNVTQIAAPLGINYIQFSPQTAFAVNPGETQVVTVTIDRSQIPPQLAKYYLQVTSNDPDTPRYPGGVHMTARYQPPEMVTMTLNIEPRLSGQVAGPGTAFGNEQVVQVNAGQQITINAQPFSPPYSFVEWREGDDVVSTFQSSLITLSGDATLTAIFEAPSAQPNDYFANRTAISGMSGTRSVSNADSALEPYEPRHADTNSPASLWWTWTAPGSGSVTIDTVGSNFDTVLAVYRGDDLRNLTEIASNDDITQGVETQSRVTFDVVQSLDYIIVVAPFDFPNLYGTIVLNWNATGTRFEIADIVDLLLGIDPPVDTGLVDFNQDARFDTADLVHLELNSPPAP